MVFIFKKVGLDSGEHVLHLRWYCPGKLSLSSFVAPIEANEPQCGLGLYTSGKAIHNDPGSGSFSCANNA